MMPATITRAAAPDVAAEEDRRFSELLRSLSADEWSAPTDCEGWDVRAMGLHVLGAAESHRVRELIHQFVRGARAAKGRPMIDGVNDVQIADRAHLTNEQLLQRLDDAAPRFRRFRARMSGPMRALRVPNPPYGWLRLGHLVDVVYTRDSWMHRVDISRAIGRAMEVDAAHDGRIVADVVAEWAATHGKPYRLELDGSAGGIFEHGTGGESHHLDAVEFCRIVSGRASGTGLLTTGVVF